MSFRKAGDKMQVVFNNKGSSFNERPPESELDVSNDISGKDVGATKPINAVSGFPKEG